VADDYKELLDWAGGVVSSMPPDQIPDNAIPQGINTAFVKIGGGKTAIGTRPGLQTVNTSILDGTPAASIHYQHPYSYTNGTSYSNYLVTCLDNGKLFYKKSDDTYTSELTPPANFPSPSTCFTSGTNPVDSVVFNNRLFLINDVGERRSLVNQTFVPWGLSPIATWSTADNGSGSSSMPNETYDVTITSYNSTTGGESSASTTKTQALASSNHRLEISITPTSSESAQYTHWRVYIRRQTTQTQLYQVLTLENSGGTTTVTDGNIPIATTTIYADLSVAQIAALTTVAPSTTENNGPPSSAQHVIAYGRRLVVSDGRNVYWSKQDKADNFDPRNYEPIDTGEGDEIRGLHPYSDELLLIFMSTAVWGIFGNDPQTWSIKPVDLTVGISTHNSIVSFEGRVGWWDEAIGPVYYDGAQITRIGQLELGIDAVTTDINTSRYKYMFAGHDPMGYRVVWSVSGLGSSVNNRLIPFNYQLNRFEASYWQTIDAASVCTGFSSDGKQRLFLGGYYGQVFYFDPVVHQDGVPSGTTTGTFVPTATSISTISGTGFYTTGAGLTGRYVVVVDDDHRPVDRVRITSNTSTTLTLATSVTGLNLATTYTYYIGGPDFRLYGKWIDHGQPFLRKRFDRLYYHMGSATGVADAYITTQLEFSDNVAQILPSGTEAAALWDVSLWDVATWAASTTLKKRLFVGRNATALRPVFYCFTPGRDLILYKVALLSRLLSDRYYG
jgi:hypothetical protein